MNTPTQVKPIRDMIKLSPIWSHIVDRYELEQLMLSGNQGEVVQGIDRQTGEKVAVKLIKDIYQNIGLTRRVISEVQVLNELTQMPNNIHTAKLLDIVTCSDKD